MADLFVRPYQPNDLEDVRTICFETGYMGDPIAWQYRDRASFCHLFCDWHALHHPDTAWVIDRDGRAVGYLLGCPDVRVGGQGAHEAAYKRDHVMKRGLFLRPGTARFLRRSATDLARDRRILDWPIDADAHPADLHIDLLPEARGQGLGRVLMNTWFDRLKELEIPGVHLGTWGENAGAISFFESMGFSQIGDRVPSPGFRLRDGGRATVSYFIRTIS